MVFSSFTFLLLFLPITLLGYYLLPGRARNVWLLALSILFYAWGEPDFIFVLLLSILLNYAFALLVEKASPRLRRRTLALGVMLNLGLLFYYKYVAFLVAQLGDMLAIFQWARPDVPDIILPIGISFFTFQGISYLVDVYRKDVPPQRSLTNVAMYIALFPQLIAGPIVRYTSIAHEIEHRKLTLDMAVHGLQLFALGLGKKVVLANSLGSVADAAFTLPTSSLATGTAWTGALAYTLQIYFDFSGYSDMAIGLGLLLGFHFPLNFNYPYIATSMTEFWRRWHISLSTWFRDYLYIPLGGNRGGSAKTYRNLFIVFCATGIWHGANWTFLIWGLWHGLFLILERRHGHALDRVPRLLRHAYVLLAVVTGWIFFRCESLPQALAYLQVLFLPQATLPVAETAAHAIMTSKTAFYLVLGSLFAAPLYPWLLRHTGGVLGHAGRVLRVVTPMTALLCSIALLASSTYNPFLYFRF